MITGETETEIMIEEEGRHLDGTIETEIDGDHRRQDTGILVENEEDCVDHHRGHLQGRLQGRLQGHLQDRLTTEIETGISQEIVIGLPQGIGFRLIHHRIEAVESMAILFKSKLKFSRTIFSFKVTITVAS